MSFTSKLAAGLLAVALSTPALAGEAIEIHDPYARSSNPKAGAAFMMIHNHGETDDRLMSVRSDVARLVQLHTHVETDAGVMKMMHIEEGFDLPAGGMVHLERGGHHIMFMGLAEPFEQGATVPVTLIFEEAGEVEIMIEVDQDRKAMHGDAEGHEHSHDHSADES